MSYTVLTLNSACKIVYRKTKLCHAFSFPPSAIKHFTLQRPTAGSFTLSLFHSIRAGAGMQTLKKVPPQQTTQTSKQKGFQRFCSQTRSGYESKFHVALENTDLATVSCWKRLSLLRWLSRGPPGSAVGCHDHKEPQTRRAGLRFETVHSKKGVTNRCKRLFNPQHMYKSEK